MSNQAIPDDARVIDYQVPEKLDFLSQPYRYKVAYGGRGGTKSWAFARELLVRGLREPIRVLCAREIQKSIQDSVHKLLSDQIAALGLSEFFEIQNTTILSKCNATEFLFSGLRHNINNLKSYEGVDIVWIEEAQSVSKASWDVLIPTIRKPNSEIWISFNPDLEDDPTYQRFVLDPPTGAKVVKINYTDNPWFPDVLKQEMEDCKRKSMQDYLHIWEGQCKQAVDGAIFANELAKAAEEHRLTRVPALEGVPVHTFWDLGHSDNTAIWFAQIVGMEYRILDYYQNNAQKMPHYIEVLAKRGYVYGKHWLPHDAEHEQLAAQNTVKEQLETALRNNRELGASVHVVPHIGTGAIAQGINAARSIFGQCVFDREKCADGLQCLRRYRYEVDEETGKIGKKPVHDIYSHGADAFRYLAVAFKPEAQNQNPVINTRWVV